MQFNKLEINSLKEQFVSEMESSIISGKLKAGDRLPAERDLAEKMGISRGIVNAGIHELSIKGFLKIVPRRGTFVENYKENGTISVLESIMRYNKGKVSNDFFDALMSTRLIIESETVYYSALQRSDEDLAELRSLLDQMKKSRKTDEIVDANFNFHHKMILASGNFVAGLILRSFEAMVKSFSKQFFSSIADNHTYIQIYEALYTAIETQQPEEAVRLLKTILNHGSKTLEDFIIVKN